MSDYIGVVTNAGQAKIAASIGGTALNLATVRVGDGNGVPITPNAAMTDLVRRVGAAYPIISSGRDPVNANHWRVTALIPVADGPFDIREIGVWDAAGDMIAVAKHVLVEKRTPAQGAAVELTTDIVFPVSETAQVTVQVTPAAQVSIFQMLRAGFTVVESATLADPPGAPLLGRTHVVPAGATGAWNGLAGYLVQWNGIVWVAVNVPDGFLVVAQDKAIDDGNRWLRKAAAGWVSALASTTTIGVTRLATAAETTARTPGLGVSPDNLGTTLDGILAKLPIHAEIKAANGVLTVTAGAGNVVVTGDVIRWRGFKEFDLTGLSLANRTFATIASQTYHLRWYAPGIGRATPAANWPLGRLYLESIGDAAYNASGFVESNSAFDTTFDSLLIARVVTSAGNAATITTLVNLSKMAGTISRASVKQVANQSMDHVVNWGRTPLVSLNSISPPDGDRDTDPGVYPAYVDRYMVTVTAIGWSDEQVNLGWGPPSWGYSCLLTA